MAWRLRLVPEKTNIDFFRWQWVTFGGSVLLMVLAFVVWGVMGLNFGIDFKGGTTMRTESSTVIDVGLYRQALEGLDLGDVAINEVFDPSFARRSACRLDPHFDRRGRCGAEPGEMLDPGRRRRWWRWTRHLKVTSAELVGPKVSGELVTSSIIALAVTSLAIMAYLWLRFEWQFALGGVLALLHDVFITVGIFALFQLKFDLTIVAALLTILGYSINDTVVVFDRLRENLVKYKTMPLRDMMNLTRQRNPEPDPHDLDHHVDRGEVAAVAGRRRDPGLRLGHLHRRGAGHLFVGLCGQEPRAVSGSGPADKPKKSGKGADHEFANIEA